MLQRLARSCLPGQPRQRRRLLGAAAGMALVILLGAVAALLPAEAAIRFKRSGESTLGGADALAGVREACELDARHVWVAVEGQGECIAFYSTPGLEGASQAVIYFEGDIPPDYRRDAAKLAGHLAALRRTLELLAATYKLPYVLVARPGTFGSTGSHADRRKVREYLVIREAVDAIRRRYGLSRITLAGQSGGATITAALLTLGLSHVRCAAPASGGYDLAAMLDWHASLQGLVGTHREHPASLSGSFDVMDRIAGVLRDPERRIFVLGDARDRITPFAQQQRFAGRIKAAGHHAEIVEAAGNGAERHGLSLASLKVAGLCASGATDAQIRRAVAK